MPGPIIAVLSLLALGIIARMSLRLICGVRGPEPGNGVHYVLSLFAWACCFAALAATGFALLVSAIIPGFIAAQAIGEVISARRQRQRAAVWSVCTRATQRGQAIGPALRGTSGRFSGKVGRAVKRLIQRVEAGAPLPNAALAEPDALPQIAPACLALSAEGGLPLRVAAEAVNADSPSDSRGEIVRILAFTLAYGGAGVSIISFFIIAIIPAFEEIFLDFDLALPPITQTVFGFADFLANYWYLFIPLPVLGAILTFGLIYLDPYTKLLLVRHQSRRQALSLLATTIEQRMPLSEAFERLSTGPLAFPDSSIAEAFHAAAASIAKGEYWLATLAPSRLIRGADLPLLRIAESAGNLPWALRSVAERQYHRAVARWHVATRACFTVVTLLFGAVVAIFAIGMFLPLVELIEGLVG